MPTRYSVSYKVREGAPVIEKTFASMTERELFIISITGNHSVIIIERWEK